MVATIIEEEGWQSATRLAIGRALLAAAASLSAAELEAATGVHQSNLKKVADRMAAEGLLRRGRSTRASARPGRTPAAYALVGDEEANVEAILAEKTTVGTLAKGQQLVIASIARAGLAELKRVVAQRGPASQIEWIALVDGEPQECFMAFEGDRAVDLANDLMAQLASAEIQCRRATVPQVLVGHRFAGPR